MLGKVVNVQIVSDFEFIRKREEKREKKKQNEKKCVTSSTFLAKYTNEWRNGLQTLWLVELKPLLRWGILGDFNDFPFASYECIVSCRWSSCSYFFFLVVVVFSNTPFFFHVCVCERVCVCMFCWTFLFIASCFYGFFFS